MLEDFKGGGRCAVFVGRTRVVGEMVDDGLVLDFVRLTFEQGFESTVDCPAERECRVPCVGFASKDQVISCTEWTSGELFEGRVVQDEQELTGGRQRSQQATPWMVVRDDGLDE